MLIRNLQHMNTFYFLSLLALCLMIIIQIKQIYENKLKYNRYLGYRQFVSINHLYV
jgi:hypothetical protein